MFGNTKLCVLILSVGLLLLSGCSDTAQSNHNTTYSSTTATHTTTTATSVVPSTPTGTSDSAITTITTGTHTTITTTTTTTRPTTPLTTVRGSHHIDAPILSQRPNYPSGCESVSAVMLLQYWGETITIDQFIDNHLPQSTHFYSENERYYGPSPYEYFIGNPRTEQAYGCMAPAIQRAIEHYYGDGSFVQNATGLTLPELCKEHIDKDRPVLVWVTIGMVETYPGNQWYLEDGTLFTWPVNEHCMMLVGYDENYYYFNDPYTGMVKKYPHWICADRYSALGQQALTIVK